MSVLRTLLLPFLKRRPDEIERRAASFAIRTPEGRDLVARLGRAFLGGYHAMLESESLDAVKEAGLRVEPHFRPFFFEGAATGFLPRGYFRRGFTLAGAQPRLLAMSPDFLYLDYVGLGFWFGIRHPRRPAALEALRPHVDPIYFPLCYDGYGFKVAFFDFPRRSSAIELLARAPVEHLSPIHQGFGRALHFVFMDDEDGFQRLRATLPPERRADLERGRSLAVGFTRIDRPEAVVRHLTSAPTEEDRASRLGGVTWALAARAMNDAVYFEQCIARAPEPWRSILSRLPLVSRDAFAASQTYSEWQERTTTAALALTP